VCGLCRRCDTHHKGPQCGPKVYKRSVLNEAIQEDVVKFLAKPVGLNSVDINKHKVCSPHLTRRAKTGWRWAMRAKDKGKSGMVVVLETGRADLCCFPSPDPRNQPATVTSPPPLSGY
jgi:hypothetical protein